MGPPIQAVRVALIIEFFWPQNTFYTGYILVVRSKDLLNVCIKDYVLILIIKEGGSGPPPRFYSTVQCRVAISLRSVKAASDSVYTTKMAKHAGMEVKSEEKYKVTAQHKHTI